MDYINRRREALKKAILDNFIHEIKEEDFKKAQELFDLEVFEKGGRSGLVKIKIYDKNNNYVYRWVQRSKVAPKKKFKLSKEIEDIHKRTPLSRLPMNLPMSEVEINADGSKGNWVLKWTDPITGKSMNSYTKEFLHKNAMKKWDKIKDIKSTDIQHINNKSNELLKSSNTSEAEAAAIVNIIVNTGLRPGSKLGFNNTENRGVSTLSKQNVKIEGDEVYFEFIGKSYKNNTAKIKSQELADFLTKHLKSKKDEDFVFDVDVKKARDLVEEISPNKKINLKDMRTFIATQIAKDILEKDKTPPLPLPEKGVKKAIQDKLKKLFVEVSDILNNTPTMAKTSYIHPQVIDNWLLSIGVSSGNLQDINKADLEDDEDYDGDVDEYNLPEWWDESI